MATIASVTTKSGGFSGFSLLAPFRAVGRFIVAMAEAGPQMRALERLSRLSDADLAAKGTTRDREVRRILGAAAIV